MQIEIRLGPASYPYFLETDGLDGIVDRILTVSASRYLIICDTNVEPLYGAAIAERLAERAPVTLLVHRVGEPSKTLAEVGVLAEAALSRGVDRASAVVAVGGGVTGNIAGLLAALLFRGIRLIHVPTSLIAMLDSVLSLKQAINSGQGKNLIGTFHAPELVLTDTMMLKTLPDREITSGLCEAVKNALAIRPQLTKLILTGPDPSGRYDPGAMQSIIAENIRAKLTVTAQDQYESWAGLALEYGHTVGHALEFTAAGALSHGEAVGLGMLIAARIAYFRGLIDVDLADLHRVLLERAGARVRIPPGLDIEKVMYRLSFDNKRGYLRVSPEESAMVLLRGHGEPVRVGGRPLTSVPMTLVRDALMALSGPAGGEAIPAADPVDRQLAELIPAVPSQTALATEDA